MSGKLRYWGLKTVATLGASEGGARSEGVGGIGRKAVVLGL